MMPLTIVMYHYVRDLPLTRYPRIKGLQVDGFRRQLDYLDAEFTIVTMEDVIGAVRGQEALPADAALLTFDDGYAEHFDTVFPILHHRGLQGSFFPPVGPLRDGRLLDVNRVHFILASVDSPARLGAAIDAEVEAAGPTAGVCSVGEYRAEWAHANRFDDAETIYVKRMLQTALPEDLRGEIAQRLFDRFVSVDEAAFAAELYLTPEQAKLMVDCGMYLGSHGVEHFWLDRVDRATQLAEINGSVDFLRDLGMPVDDHWVMCYPYGAWDERLRGVVHEQGGAIGLTTRVATAEIGVDHPLALPRYDTNDFPQ